MDEQEIFLTALERPTRDARDAWLDCVCGADPKLRARIEALLKRYDDSGSFLERPAEGMDGDSPFDALRAEFDAGAGILEPQQAAGASAPSLDFLSPSSRPGALGKIGRYDVLSVIGTGGMGVVLEAHDPELERTVAVKVLAADLAANPQARLRFVREARLAGAASHPNIVAVYSVEDDQDLPFLVMERICGMSLWERIDRDGPMPQEAVVRIGAQIAAGLAAAHQRGLVHRDVKPANILLEHDLDWVKITDFGLARANDEATITQAGEVSGTPQFMSPEQARGQRVDHRSDLFSLGSVLYTMCTGRSPFRADTAEAVLCRVVDDTPQPIDEINPRIALWLRELIGRLLAKNPSERFQSASEVATALRCHHEGLTPPSGQAPAGCPQVKGHPSKGWLAGIARLGLLVARLVRGG